MSFSVEVRGLAEFRQVVKAASGELDKELQKNLIAAVGPIVADAQSRFNSLPGTGPRTAKQVSGSADQRAVSVRLVSKGGFELGREFGSKGPKTSSFITKSGVRVTRTIDYSRPHIFGPWQGNQFVLPPGHSGGNAFLPAVSSGAGRAIVRIDQAIERIVDKMANG